LLSRFMLQRDLLPLLFLWGSLAYLARTDYGSHAARAKCLPEGG